MADTAFIELNQPITSKDQGWAAGKSTANKKAPLRFTKRILGGKNNIHEMINTEAEKNVWLIHAVTMLPDESSSSLVALVTFERTPESKA